MTIETKDQSTDKELTGNDILSDLMDDDEEEPVKDEEEKIEAKTDDEPEIKEDEEDEKEIESEDEEIELVTPVSRKAIIAKYPNFFKEFKYVEKAMYRDREFTELLGDPADAKEVIEKAETLDKFEADIVDGNIEKVLSVVHSRNKESFNKIADNYLQVLGKIDQNAYYHVVGSVFETAVNNMLTEARALGEEGKPLETAAKILNRYIFGTAEVKSHGKLSRPESQTDNTESDKLRAERAQFIQEKFEAKRDDLDKKVRNQIKSTIESHIDPKDEMTDYVKKAAIREAIENIENLIDGDESYQKIKDKLWEKAFENNFSDTFISRIQSAHLSKAKTHLKDVIKAARIHALKGLGKKVSDDKDRKGPLPANRSVAERKAPSKPGEIPRGMKSLDYLMQD